MASDARQPAHRHWWRSALLILAALAGLAAALAAWLTGSESGARMALSALSGSSAAPIRFDGIHGRLAGPLRIDRVTIARPNQNVLLEQVELDWRPTALASGLLHVTLLHIGQASVSSKIDQHPEPARMPDRIGLPFALQVDEARLDGGRIDWGPLNLIRLGGLSFSLDFDQARYRLRLHRLSAQSAPATSAFAGNASGTATLDTAKPYALHAQFTSDAATSLGSQAIDARGHVNLDGSLAELAANLDLTLNQARAQGHATLRPFSPQPLGDTTLSIQALDLAAFGPTLPHTALDASLRMAHGGTGEVTLVNHAAGLYDEGRLPLAELHAGIRQDAGQFLFERIVARTGSAAQPAGAITGDGRYGNGGLTLALAVDALDLHRIDGKMLSTRLAGKIALEHGAGKQHATVELSQPLNRQPLSISASATLADMQLAIDHAELRLGNARAAISAQADLAGTQRFSIEGEVNRFRLQDLGRFASLPTLDLSGNFSLHGERLPRLSADAAFRIVDSRLAGRALQGEGQVQLRADRLLVPTLFLFAGDNRIEAHGELSQRNAQLSFRIAAPALAQFGPDFAGALEASGTASGSITQPRISVTWQGDKLRMPGRFQAEHTEGKLDATLDRSRPSPINAATLDASARGINAPAGQLGSLSAHVRFATRPDAPLALEVHAKEFVSAALRADAFDAAAQGVTARHTLNATLAETGGNQRWAVGASGGLDQHEGAMRWQGTLDRFDASGLFGAHLAAPAALSLSSQRVQLGRFRLDADSTQITVEQFVRDAHGVATQGRVDRLQLAQLLKFAGNPPALSTDLLMSGAWDIRLAETVNGSIRLQREGGDIVMHGDTPVALGLRRLDASATATDGALHVQLDANGQQLGRIEASMRTRTAGGKRPFDLPPEAPLTGAISIDIPTLAWLGPMIAPTIASEGRLQSDIAIGGTFAQPALSGRITGSGLRLLASALGLDLRQGILDSEFQGDTLMVKNLAFQGSEGSVTVGGPIRFFDGKTSANMLLKAQHFALLNRSDRRLAVSGAARIGWNEAGYAAASGTFDIDSGFFDIGREDMPQLSDDVVVIGRRRKSADRIAASVDLNINLGNNVVLRGRGLDAVLAGQVRLTSTPDTALRAQGTVRIPNGTYTAYGRKLAIEQGVLRFNGPVNNPALDILAMRRGQEVEAGVAVRGTVLAPRVTLVSEPSVPDADKLSWLVLGRGLSSAGSADLDALQSAAGALLSQGAASGVQSQIATAFGLDDLRIATSQDNLQQRIVTLGKRLSSRLYVSYQQSLQSASSVVLLRYTLNPRLTLEAEAGTHSAISLFYNIAFD
ncbi:MAG TPA: translocation/assembly module TamB domain-containing protein [Paucimonas sp.]|nr:translocation/assembly module TamB domain-containing protein [Paucimonas sp.]